MKVIVLASQKDGSAKTTLTASLAVAEALADARERNNELSGPGAWVQDDGEEVPF